MSCESGNRSSVVVQKSPVADAFEGLKLNPLNNFPKELEEARRIYEKVEAFLMERRHTELLAAQLLSSQEDAYTQSADNESMEEVSSEELEKFLHLLVRGDRVPDFRGSRIEKVTSDDDVHKEQSEKQKKTFTEQICIWIFSVLFVLGTIVSIARFQPSLHTMCRCTCILVEGNVIPRAQVGDNPMYGNALVGSFVKSCRMPNGSCSSPSKSPHAKLQNHGCGLEFEAVPMNIEDGEESDFQFTLRRAGCHICLLNALEKQLQHIFPHGLTVRDVETANLKFPNNSMHSARCLEHPVKSDALSVNGFSCYNPKRDHKHDHSHSMLAVTNFAPDTDKETTTMQFLIIRNYLPDLTVFLFGTLVDPQGEYRWVFEVKWVFLCHHLMPTESCDFTNQAAPIINNEAFTSKHLFVSSMKDNANGGRNSSTDI